MAIKDKKYYEAKLMHLRNLVKTGNVGGIEAFAGSPAEIKTHIEEYKKFPGHDVVLAGAGEIIYHTLMEMH
jgi:hypothetical protein